MQKSEIKDLIKQNFYRIPVAPRSITIREWEKLEPAQVYELLQNCSPFAQATAKELIKHMTTTKWTLKATAHDQGSTNPDDRLHITIGIGNRKANHLYCREIHGGRGLQITKIT